MILMPIVMATLDCDHCGGIAILSPDGSFGDGDGESCATCGHPGHVVVTQECDDEGDESNVAYWSVSEGATDYCNEADCDDCKERGR